MTNAERVHRWNTWYDALPDRWRFQVVLWPLLLVGTINMLLTIAGGFPFGLLVILAIAVLAYLRVPYKAGWVAKGVADGGGAGGGSESASHTVQLGRVDWAYELNQRYDAMPEWRRFWVFPAILIVAGLINMWLTLSAGFPFALLFLLALLIIVGLRAPYSWGWLTPPPGHRPVAAPTIAAPAGNLHLAHEPTAPLVVAAPMMAPEPVPLAAAEPPAGEDDGKPSSG